MKNIKADIQNWRTTIVGFLTGLVLAGSQIINLLDNDPETICDFKILIAAFGAMGIGVFAKDGDKTSEDLGIK